MEASRRPSPEPRSSEPGTDPYLAERRSVSTYSASVPEMVPSGWLTFAGLVLITVGCFNLISGFFALFQPSHFVRTGSGLMILNYTTWGWVLMLFGALEFFTGIGAMSGSGWARGLGITLAVLNAVAHLAFMSVFPFWSLTVIALDMLVIYGLTKPMVPALR